jgi:LPXTG-motif cell wall-anchored protein
MSIKPVTMLAASCLVVCASAGAQTKVDRSFKAVSKDCSGIEWSEEALARYPTIASACQGVEERNGKTYVKFEGTVKRNVKKGEQLVVNFKDGGEVTLDPPDDLQLNVDGKRVPLASLRRGDALNFYIAEDRFAAQFPETETVTARLIVVPIASPEQVESEERMAALPSTASPLPLVALGGLLSLGLGGLLTLYRRRR